MSVGLIPGRWPGREASPSPACPLAAVTLISGIVAPTYCRMVFPAVITFRDRPVQANHLHFFPPVRAACVREHGPRPPRPPAVSIYTIGRRAGKKIARPQLF